MLSYSSNARLLLSVRYFSGRRNAMVIGRFMKRLLFYAFINASILLFGIGYGQGNQKNSRSKLRSLSLSQESLQGLARVERRLDNHLFKLTKGCNDSCAILVKKKLAQLYSCSQVVYLKQLHTLECSNCSHVQNGTKIVAAIPELLGVYKNERIALPVLENVTDPYVELKRMKRLNLNYTTRVTDSTWKMAVTWENWHLDRIDQFDGYPDLDETFNTNCFPRQGQGVRIYVIDSGCRDTHDQFTGRISLRTTGSYGSGSDDNGHGTHVAGLAAGSTSGVCKKCEVICYKALGENGGGSFADIGEAIDDILYEQHIDPGPAVAVLSLGAKHESTMLDGFVTTLHESGVIPVVAAGNYNDNTCDYTPARAEGAVAVGATDITDSIFRLSNYGSCLQYLAPGEGVYSASFKSDDGVEVRSGTSMAAPIVAGAMALLLAEDPSLTQKKIHRLLALNAKTLEYKKGQESYTKKMVRLGQDACSMYNFSGEARRVFPPSKPPASTSSTAAPQTVQSLSASLSTTGAASTLTPTRKSNVDASTVGTWNTRPKSDGAQYPAQDYGGAESDRSNSEKTFRGMFSCKCPVLALIKLCFSDNSTLPGESEES